MFCKYCGKTINPSPFCKYCGRTLALQGQKASSPTPEHVGPHLGLPPPLENVEPRSSPPPLPEHLVEQESTPNLPQHAWYYETDGTRHGPVDTQTITQLIVSGTLSRSHKVWRHGLQDWTMLETTDLGTRFTGPPPLTKDSVNNGVVWVIALCPLISLIDADLWWIAFVVLPLCWLDQMVLRKAGHDTSHFGFWWLFLVPVYLYRRATALKQYKTYFFVNILAFGLAIYVPLNAGPDTSQMEHTIQAGLTDRNTLGQCQKVTVLHKSGNEYTGLAEMSDGNTVTLEIIVDKGKLIWRVK